LNKKNHQLDEIHPKSKRRPAFFVRQFLVFCINLNNFANFLKHSPSFQYQKIGGEAHVSGIVGFRVVGN
jgi:hypothetical protein